MHIQQNHPNHIIYQIEYTDIDVKLDFTLSFTKKEIVQSTITLTYRYRFGNLMGV